jgi:hypothetical protein
MRAPQNSIEYYAMAEDATMRDLLLNVRADEATHRELNHHFADIPTYEAVDHLHVEVQEEGPAKRTKLITKTPSKDGDVPHDL